VLTSEHVSDEIIGLHCQQAVEKNLQAIETHEIGALMALLAQAGNGLRTGLRTSTR
jgi:hypothetical protein